MDPVVKNKEEAFLELEKDRNYNLMGPRQIFRGGWDACEQNALRSLQGIREAVGDPEGNLTHKELVERVREAFIALRACEGWLRHSEVYNHAWTNHPDEPGVSPRYLVQKALGLNNSKKE